MTAWSPSCLRGLLRREFAEHRNIFVLTPMLLVLAQVLLVLLGMFVAMQLLTDNLDKVGAWVASSGTDVTVVIKVDEPIEPGSSVASGKKPLPGAVGPVGSSGSAASSGIDASGMLSVLLPLVHLLFVGVLVLVSVIFLLGTLYNDRRDRSILFFKSMPVAEWQELGSKLLVAWLLAPIIFLLASWVSQWVLWLVLVVAGDSSGPGSGQLPFSLLQLWMSQLLALLTGLLWVVPFYSWLLLSSALANRSPALIAILVPIGLVIVERIVWGSNHLAALMQLYLPRLSPVQSVLDDAGLAPGLMWLAVGWCAAALMLAATTWLRRFRFEL